LVVGNNVVGVAPVITLTAAWKVQYDVMKFKVMDCDYCDVLVDRNINKVVYPQAPVMNVDEMKFIGWDVAEGDYLSGSEDNSPVVCEG
jgi:hypothetical protein